MSIISLVRTLCCQSKQTRPRQGGQQGSTSTAITARSDDGKFKIPSNAATECTEGRHNEPSTLAFADPHYPIQIGRDSFLRGAARNGAAVISNGYQSQ